jgi:dihydrofolate reductase
MAKLRVHNFMISLDGYAAGPNQSMDNPLGERGFDLHRWRFAEPGEVPSVARAGADTSIDSERNELYHTGIGATIMGRNMFGPYRGPWEDESWTGWWGEDPPYHNPVFVLTHHLRPSIPMQGGTTFHFVSDGIESALDQAFAAANGQDVLIGGGASTVQQYLRAGLIDDLHLAIVPVLLGQGERLFDNLDGGPKGYEVVEYASSPNVMHVHLTRRNS